MSISDYFCSAYKQQSLVWFLSLSAPLLGPHTEGEKKGVLGTADITTLENIGMTDSLLYLLFASW